MNNRIRQRVRTRVKINFIQCSKMTDEEKEAILDEFWRRFDLMRKTKGGTLDVLRKTS